MGFLLAFSIVSGAIGIGILAFCFPTLGHEWRAGRAERDLDRERALIDEVLP